MKGAAPSTTGRQSVKGGKEITITRLTQEDKEELADSDVAAFVTLPKSLDKGRSQAFALLHDLLLRDKPKGLATLVPSPQNYLAAVFNTEQYMKKFCEKTNGKAFPYNNKNYGIIAVRFADALTQMSSAAGVSLPARGCWLKRDGEHMGMFSTTGSRQRHQ
ncbi:uncharacterized protein SPSK_09899 [Sporothrix schenckii 1099-18]|uniref:Uncharacterized protein n=1 Tax=Sporothrix schenckii 1099-18 TaxID=1397361 RepID=A0A0F2M7F0_SPOSC|nr:uncharacterized protein SPSK_09899 [Sporothrix schenckii 1099-18]KJR84994.1 hypothetical protein SPSK_09899 [Sporothrix schenckii 1099-18]